jgi:hypothetical protein
VQRGDELLLSLPAAAAEASVVADARSKGKPVADALRRFPRTLETAAAVEASARAETQCEVLEPRQLFLPGFDIGAMPNHLNRSSFIAPIARGQRKFHRQTTMVTRRDCFLEYTGEQLDEADGDLIMALIFFAQPHQFGTPVPLNRKRLLRKIKSGEIGTTQYKWLHGSMKRLREGTLFLEAKKPDGTTRYSIGKMRSFSVLKDLGYDDENEIYTYTLDPRWVVMFGNREYSLMDWDKRMQIRRGLDMAKTLQRLVATSDDQVQRYALDGLKAQMEYASPMRKFRSSLEAAARELERLDIIGNWRFEESTKGKPQLALWLQQPVA